MPEVRRDRGAARLERSCSGSRSWRSPVVVVALVRQIGVLHERVAPAGALMLGRGPRGRRGRADRRVAGSRGRRAPSARREPHGAARCSSSSRRRCPVCKTLLPALRSHRAREAAWLDVVLASDGPRAEHRAFVARAAARALPVRAVGAARPRLSGRQAALRGADRRARACSARRGSSTRASISRVSSRRRSAAWRRSRNSSATRPHGRGVVVDGTRAPRSLARDAARAGSRARTSRRSFLARLGARAGRRRARCRCFRSRAHAPPTPRAARPTSPASTGDAGDPTSCDYWRHCAIDGFLCSCCGGTQNGVSAGHRDVARHLDRHLPQSRPTARTTSSRTTTAAGRASAGAATATATKATPGLRARRRATTSIWCFGTKSRRVQLLGRDRARRRRRVVT